MTAADLPETVVYGVRLEEDAHPRQAGYILWLDSALDAANMVRMDSAHGIKSTVVRMVGRIEDAG